jgi:hypothetical protein
MSEFHLLGSGILTISWISHRSVGSHLGCWIPLDSELPPGHLRFLGTHRRLQVHIQTPDLTAPALYDLTLQHHWTYGGLVVWWSGGLFTRSCLGILPRTYNPSPFIHNSKREFQRKITHNRAVIRLQSWSSHIITFTRNSSTPSTCYDSGPRTTLFQRIQQHVPENSTPSIQSKCVNPIVTVQPGDYNSEYDSARELTDHLGQHVANCNNNLGSYIKVVLGCRETKQITMKI